MHRALWASQCSPPALVWPILCSGAQQCPQKSTAPQHPGPAVSVALMWHSTLGMPCGLQQNGETATLLPHTQATMTSSARVCPPCRDRTLQCSRCVVSEEHGAQHPLDIAPLAVQLCLEDSAIRVPLPFSSLTFTICPSFHRTPVRGKSRTTVPRPPWLHRRTPQRQLCRAMQQRLTSQTTVRPLPWCPDRTAGPAPLPSLRDVARSLCHL